MDPRKNTKRHGNKFFNTHLQFKIGQSSHFYNHFATMHNYYSLILSFNNFTMNFTLSRINIFKQLLYQYNIIYLQDSFTCTIIYYVFKIV